MYTRMIHPTKSNSYFIFGARGTGKSTLLKHLYQKKDHLWIDLLLPSEEEQYLLNPELLRQKLKTSDIKTVIIDEIQKIPKLLDVVHSMIEEEGVTFILIGSSARQLKAQGANLLAGRAFDYSLYPLSIFELADDYNLTRSLSYGLLPQAYQLSGEDQKDFLRSYIQKYIKEEIQMEQLVRDLVPFRKFLSVAAQSNGEILNYSKIGRNCGLDYKSVSRYFEILSDTFLGVYLDSYHRSMGVRQIESPKFYFFDPGVVRAMQNQLTQEIVPSNYVYGRLFETLVIMEFIKLNSYLRKDFMFSYLKTTDGAEIDLIVEEPSGQTWIIEIKSTDRVTVDDYRSLKNFLPSFPKTCALVLSRDPNHRIDDDVEIIPYLEGIKKIFALKDG